MNLHITLVTRDVTHDSQRQRLSLEKKFRPLPQDRIVCGHRLVINLIIGVQAKLVNDTNEHLLICMKPVAVTIELSTLA